MFVHLYLFFNLYIYICTEKYKNLNKNKDARLILKYVMQDMQFLKV